MKLGSSDVYRLTAVMGMVKKVEILRLRTLELLLNVHSFSKVHPLALALTKFMVHTHKEVGSLSRENPEPTI
jgi:hypothetical protein